MNKTTLILLVVCLFLGVFVGVPKDTLYQMLVQVGALILALAFFYMLRFICNTLIKPSEQNKDDQ